MQQYLDLLSHMSGAWRGNVPTAPAPARCSVFGHQMRFDLADGFPLVTTKKLHLKSIVHELLWFLAGDTNIALPAARTACASGTNGPTRTATSARSTASNGAPGPAPDGGTIDQIAWVEQEIRRNPDSRRLSSPPGTRPRSPTWRCRPAIACSSSMSTDDRLSCQLYQRSGDVFLGVPFNIASYALLTMMMAQVTGLRPGEFIHTFGDVHLYSNHLDQAREQLARTPRPLPRMRDQPRRPPHLRLRLRGFHPQGLRPAPAHQGRGRGMTSLPAGTDV